MESPTAFDCLPKLKRRINLGGGGRRTGRKSDIISNKEILKR